jgi:hypothetical protein
MMGYSSQNMNYANGQNMNYGYNQNMHYGNYQGSSKGNIRGGYTSFGGRGHMNNSNGKNGGKGNFAGNLMQHWNVNTYMGKGGKGNGGINSFEEDGMDTHENPVMMNSDGHMANNEMAMWSLQVDNKEEEAAPELSISSDKEAEYVKVVNKNKLRANTMMQPKFVHKNKFQELLEVGCLVEEEGEQMVATCQETEDRCWRKVTATVDSGSANHVAPEGEFDHIKLEQSEGSKAGTKYVTADGHRVPNLGQKLFPMFTENRRAIAIQWQITKVVKLLLSVSKLNENGNTVILDSRRPVIIGADGYVTPLRRRNGTFECDLWIYNPKGFPRQ